MKILQFSGGKDSLACLYLLQDQWEEITVVWGNTGAAYPETLEFMNEVRNMVPHFIEVQSDQSSYVQEFGYPTDILPIRSTRFGQMVHGTDSQRYTDYLSCCSHNIWKPVEKACKELGATVIYRGQRTADNKKNTLKSGDVIDGITYIHPIENWSSDQVIEFLGDRLPEYYKTEKSSHDCWSCTAHLEDNKERISNLPQDKKKFMSEILIDMRDVLKKDMNHLDGVLNGLHD